MRLSTILQGSLVVMSVCSGTIDSARAQYVERPQGAAPNSTKCGSPYSGYSCSPGYGYCSYPAWYGYGYPGYNGYVPWGRVGLLHGWADVLRGEAELVRGQGEFLRNRGEGNFWNSKAAINNQKARSLSIDNNLKFEKVYFEMRRINESERVAEIRQRTPPKSLELGMNKPSRPTLRELDPFSGQINWPEKLQADEYSEMREEIDSMFAEWAAANRKGVASMDHARLSQALKAMHLQLLKHVREPDQMGYAAAKKFIGKLGYEARFSQHREDVAAH